MEIFRQNRITDFGLAQMPRFVRPDWGFNISNKIYFDIDEWYKYGIIRPYKERSDFMTQMLPKILPVNELKNTSLIMKTCKESDVPIVITRNGYGEAVMMSISLYEELFAKLHEALLINEALEEINKGAKGVDGLEFIKELKQKYEQ